MGEKSLEHFPNPDPKTDAGLKEPQFEDDRALEQNSLAQPSPSIEGSPEILDGLPPIPTRDSQPLSENIAKPRTTTDPQQKMVESLNSASSRMLIAFGTGLVGFGAGIAVAVMVLNGVIDLQAQWVRDIIASLRG